MIKKFILHSGCLSSLKSIEKYLHMHSVLFKLQSNTRKGFDMGFARDNNSTTEQTIRMHSVKNQNVYMQVQLFSNCTVFRLEIYILENPLCIHEVQWTEAFTFSFTGESKPLHNTSIIRTPLHNRHVSLYFDIIINCVRTLEPLLIDPFIIRTPLHYRQVSLYFGI